MVVGDFAIELDTVVVGSGPGGYVAAIRASQLGQKVAIIERDYMGGVCLNVGCIPSKALIHAGHVYHQTLKAPFFGIHTEGVSVDWDRTQAWKDDEVVAKLTSGVEMLLKKNKVEIIRGEAYIQDANHLRVITDDSAQSYTFKHAIIATGSSPIELEGFPFSDRVLDSTGGLNLKEIPKELVVIGAGYIGAELAGVFANFGSKITILEGSGQILPSFDKDMAKLVEKRFKDSHKNVEIITNAQAKSSKMESDKVHVTYEVNGEEATLTADYCLVTVGRRPNTQDNGLEDLLEMDDQGFVVVDKQGRTSVDNIFAIGDIVAGDALAHKASYEGKVAAAAISGQADEVDYVAMPAVCFTDPELASVGHTKTSAKKAGLEVKTTKFPLGGNGRAISMDETDGFIRLVTTQEGDILVGAQIAGPGASDLVAELALAIEAGMNAEDISLTIHPHPTISEGIMDAAEAARGLPIHM